MASPRSHIHHDPSPGSAAWKRVRLPVTAAAVVISVAAIVGLSLDARQRILVLDAVEDDHLHWLLAEIHDEVLELRSAVLEERLNPGAGLDAARLNFQVLAAHVGELVSTPRDGGPIPAEGYAEDIAALARLVGGLEQVFAAGDATLRGVLPEISARILPAEAAAASLELRSESAAQLAADAERLRLGGALLRLVLLTVLLVVMLSVLSIQLLRLYLGSKEKAEESLRTGARLETIFATSADAILVTDLEGRVQDCNRAAVAIFGYPREALIGANAMTMLFPPDTVAAQQAQLSEAVRTANFTAANPLRLEVEAQHATGQRFPVECSLALARADSGSIVVALLRDISARRHAERDLTEARDRALAGERAKANFLAVMSHEMRTPLNGLKGSIELIAHTPLDARQRDLVRVLGTSAEILLDHVNSVLDIARFEAQPMEPVKVAFDLDKLIGDCVANQVGLAASAGNRIEVRTPGGPLGTVMGNPMRLRQILLNLLNNAAKFTHDGRITVETEAIRDETGPMFEIRVIDTGIGIAAADLDRIFEDFVTLDSGYDRRSGGTGLGLGIARRLARAMGGDIGAFSMPNRGSRFWLRLPLIRAEMGALPAPQAEEEPSTRPDRLTVLVIEDNDINRFIARSFIESEGHVVVEARDGKTGLAEAQTRAFDVVLTDISMPGLDGFQVARRIRDGGGPSAGSRILALTAHALSSQQEEMRGSGLDGFLQKPVGRTDLLRSLQPGPIAQPPEEPEALDPAPLAELEEQLGPIAVAALIRQMLGDGEMLMQRIAALGAEPDPKTLGALAHQFAGAIGTFGAHPLHGLLRQMMQDTREGTVSATDLGALPGLWQSTRSALERRLRPTQAGE